MFTVGGRLGEGLGDCGGNWSLGADDKEYSWSLMESVLRSRVLSKVCDSSRVVSSSWEGTGKSSQEILLLLQWSILVMKWWLVGAHYKGWACSNIAQYSIIMMTGYWPIG